MSDKDTSLYRSYLCVNFIDLQRQYRTEIREKSKSSNADLLTAHQLAFSAVVSYQDRIKGIKYDTGDTSVNGRMALIAQFVLGIDLAETAITEGLYPQAANLLKQELETLAAIDELEEGARRDGKTPGFKGRFARFGRKYGELNEIAHPTRTQIVEELSRYTDADSQGPTPLPQFDESLWRLFYGFQALFLIMLFGSMRTLFVQVFQVDWDDEEVNLAGSAHKLLLEQGIVISPPA